MAEMAYFTHFPSQILMVQPGLQWLSACSRAENVCFALQKLQPWIALFFFFFFLFELITMHFRVQNPMQHLKVNMHNYSTVANIVRIRLGISLSHNCGLSLWNIYCSVKYEHAVVASRCHQWAGGSLFIVCVRRSGLHGQLMCRRNTEFLCQHPQEHRQVYGCCRGSYSVAWLLVACLLTWWSNCYLVRYHHSACVAAHLVPV